VHVYLIVQMVLLILMEIANKADVGLVNNGLDLIVCVNRIMKELIQVGVYHNAKEINNENSISANA